MVGEGTRRVTKKALRREETRGRLIAAARRLFGLHGYDDVPVTEIAEAAGVSHSMINSYFGGKAGLLYEIVRGNNEPQYAESLAIRNGPGTAWERLSALLLAWTLRDGEEPRLLSVMQGYSWVWSRETEAENAGDRMRFLLVIEDILLQGQAAGEFTLSGDTGAAAEAVLALYTWGLREIVFHALRPEECHARTMVMVRLVTGTGRTVAPSPVPDPDPLPEPPDAP